MHNGICTEPNMAALFALMWDVLRQRGTVTFTAAPCLPADTLGEIEFATNQVSLSPELNLTEFTETIAHELVHVLRGPAREDQVDIEEQNVERLAQRLLYGSSAAPARPHLFVLQGGAR